MIRLFAKSLRNLTTLTRATPRFHFSALTPDTEPQVSLTENPNSWSYELLNQDIKGVKYSPAKGNYIIMYTCGVCNHRQSRSFSKNAYHEGVVLVRCESCDKMHLIADNLKWFDNFTQNIEEIMARKNQTVTKVVADQDLQEKLIPRMKHDPEAGPRIVEGTPKKDSN